MNKDDIYMYKICGVDVLHNAANCCYLVGNFGKKDASVYSFNLRTNYLLRLHVHPYFIGN